PTCCAVGRGWGGRVLAGLPGRWRPASERARTLVRRHASRIMLLLRFAYGIGLPLRILCGVARIEPARFLLYNVGTALGWALLFTWIGYGYGAAANAVLGRVARGGTWILAGAVVLGLLVHALSRRAGGRLS